ncbi:MAG TPA: DUF3306 domain-containing protein [Burkholderiales bacterium]
MTVDDKETFLSRWSRRKLDAKEDAPAGAPQAAELPAAAPVAPLLPATEPPAPGTSEDISSEYREFFDPQVDEKLRRTALRKLFGDPHFNVMDGLDTYIDDYSKPDPIPEAMLRQLNQAKALFLFDDEEKEAAAAAELSAGEGETTAAPLGSEASAHAELPAPAAAATDGDAADSAVPLHSDPGIVP